MPTTNSACCFQWFFPMMTFLLVDWTTTTFGHALTLFPYQEEGIERLVRDRRVLLADQMGLGKGVQAIGALNRLLVGHPDDQQVVTNSSTITPILTASTSRILIVCAKSVLGVWQDELDRWLDPQLKNILPIHMAAGKTPPFQPHKDTSHTTTTHTTTTGWIQLMNYDICHKHRAILQSTRYDVVICDEAHYLKSMDSQRTRAVLGHCNKTSSTISSTHYLWLLTGTPILNRPVELYPLLRAIDPNAWGSFLQYTKRYCAPQQGKWGRELTGASHLGELSRRLQPIMVRRYKTDVLEDLPPKLRSCVRLNGSETAVAMERESVAELVGSEPGVSTKDVRVDVVDRKRKQEDINLTGFSADAAGLLNYPGISEYVLNIIRERDGDTSSRKRVLGALAKIRKETALLKARPAIQLLKDAMMSHKVVVFAHHRALIHELVKEFGDAAVGIVGGMDTAKRTEAVKRFQNDDSVRLFVGSIRAAGVGVTLTAASHVVFLELDWSPAIMAQAEDRCHRVGQHDSVQVQYYVFQDTLDEWIARQLLSKQEDIDRVLPSSRSLAQQEVYIIEFGKHKGLRFEDLPSDYLFYIVEKDNGAIWRSRPELWRALARSGLVQEQPPHRQQKRSPRNVDYVFDFGRHNGKQWKEVPSSYRDWIMREQVWQTKQTLKNALRSASQIHESD